MRKYKQWADVKLYILGHTDTVGANASNRTLSFNRAKSIGGSFRRKGVRIPILYDGFGEDALLVQTADETDEPKNRRADYILSVESPVRNSALKPNWQKL